MTPKLDVMACVTNILQLLTNIKSADIRSLDEHIMDFWSQNENQLAKKMLASAKVLRIELVFILHPQMILVNDFLFVAVLFEPRLPT
jgi:hypothetical protein